MGETRWAANADDLALMREGDVEFRVGELFVNNAGERFLFQRGQVLGIRRALGVTVE